MKFNERLKNIRQESKFSDNLKEVLIVHKMTQQELADNLNTTQATVSRWLNGINEPDFSTLLKICLILGETPNSILGFEEITDNRY